MTPPDSRSEEDRIERLMRPGPDDDERDMAENFDEWLKDEATGCTTPPSSTTPPETVHDKLAQFVEDVQ